MLCLKKQTSNTSSITGRHFWLDKKTKLEFQFCKFAILFVDSSGTNKTKGIVDPKIYYILNKKLKLTFCHHLLALMSFQTCMSLFLMLNIKYDILKNAGNQTVDGPHLLQ